eukprot:gene4751-8333_t
MFLKQFTRRKLKKFYSKNSLEQVCFSLIEANRQCQLSSSMANVQKESDAQMHTSLVPYRIIDKDIAQMYDVKPSNSFLDYELLFCSMKTSPHFDNLIEREGIPNIVSFSFGQNQFVEEFSKINLYSPRCLLTASAIPVDSKTKDNLWEAEFSNHPNMKRNKDEISIYQMNTVVTPHYVDYGGNLNYLNSTIFKKSKKSEISKKMYEIIKRFNKNIKEMDELILKGYNIDCEEKFIFHVDNFGMNVLGKLNSDKNLPVDTKATEWSEFYLDFGEEMKNEQQLTNFLLKFHETTKK